MDPHENMRRFIQYRICQERGHQSDSTLTTNPPQFRCKHCGTIYYYESVLRESNVPEILEDDS